MDAECPFPVEIQLMISHDGFPHRGQCQTANGKDLFLNVIQTLSLNLHQCDSALGVLFGKISTK